MASFFLLTWATLTMQIQTKILACLILISLVLSGCTTTRTSDTARTGMEHLLISNAIDQTLDKTALPPVEDRKVFIEEKYMDAVDKGYIVAKMRQRLLNSGAKLVDKKEDSEITIELCSGGVGTDNVSSFIGTPGLSVPGLPVELPEVRVYEKSSQFGTAKIGVVAYATGSGQLIYDAGTPLARADESRWSVLGIGPFQNGSVRDEVMTQTGDTDFTARVANAVDFG
ncbi:MAG: DUF6655 family protein, partial [Planctomycetota bacterium]